jgi:RND family efflux transporter MFP subunit
MRSHAGLAMLLSPVLGIALLVGCGKAQPPSARPAASGPTRAVSVGQVQSRTMERAIAVTGSLFPQEKSTLSAKVSGRVQSLAVDIGTPVRKGDLIAQIDPRDYQLRVQQAAAALAEARAALGLPLEGDKDQIEQDQITSVKQARAILDEASRSQERVRNLTKSQIASASELDTVESAYKVALSRYETALQEGQARLAALSQRRAEFEIARKQLSDASVLAPFDGTIQTRQASVGEYVGPGAPIVTLVKTDPLRLRLEVPEREAMLVKLGLTVRLTVQGNTNVFVGQIARLSPALNESNRMLLVEADVPSLGVLRGGLFARAWIVVDPYEQGLAVPASALVTFAGIEKVLTIRDGKALEKPVVTARRGPGWVEVLSGITEGTPVILDPAGLRSGQPVSVREATDTISQYQPTAANFSAAH